MQSKNSQCDERKFAFDEMDYLVEVNTEDERNRHAKRMVVG